MNATPGLRLALAFSVAAHAALFLLFSVAAKNFKVTVPRDVYRVSLVSPAEVKRWQVREPSGQATPSARGREAVGKMAYSEEREAAVSRVYRSERLRAMEEKVEAERYKDKRLAEIEKGKRLDDIRKSAIGSEEKAPRPAPPTGPPGAPSASVLDAYTARVKADIESAWPLMDIDWKGRSATVAVRIESDGTIVVKRFERPSGNRLFDSSLLKAIAKASPVEPPPFGADDYLLRFAPEEE
jgi:colicin import membrane protein